MRQGFPRTQVGQNLLEALYPGILCMAVAEHGSVFTQD